MTIEQNQRRIKSITAIFERVSEYTVIQKMSSTTQMIFLESRLIKQSAFLKNHFVLNYFTIQSSWHKKTHFRQKRWYAIFIYRFSFYMWKKTQDKISKKKLSDENVELAKLIAKVRDKYTCQHCWKTAKQTMIHGSHIINEWKDHRLASDPYNIKALCYNCHINWRHKNPLEASERFKEKRPWRYEELQEKHIEYMSKWSIDINRMLERNQRLRKQCDEMKIDISKFKYWQRFIS